MLITRLIHTCQSFLLHRKRYLLYNLNSWTPEFKPFLKLIHLLTLSLSRRKWIYNHSERTNWMLVFSDEISRRKWWKWIPTHTTQLPGWQRTWVVDVPLQNRRRERKKYLADTEWCFDPSFRNIEQREDRPAKVRSLEKSQICSCSQRIFQKKYTGNPRIGVKDQIDLKPSDLKPYLWKAFCTKE